MNDLILYQDDFMKFREWINLNISEITWQNRYEEDFEDFWSLFFVEGLSLKQINDRFEYAVSNINTGPLVSWFSWLRQKLICYVFIFKDQGIYSISQQTGISYRVIANLFRDFFCELYPFKEMELNEIFQIGNCAGENLYLKFSELNNKVEGIGKINCGSFENEVMTSLEITLYEEWKDFSIKIKKDFLHKQFDYKALKDKASLSRQFKIFRDAFVLLAITFLLIAGVKYANDWYKTYLEDKISIYEPQFFWLDKALKFKEVKTADSYAQFELNEEALEEIKTDDKFVKQDFDEEERIAPESEVSIASLDALPKDFASASLEQSQYEEDEKGGYRDTRFGSRKVYRVMMSSVAPKESREKVNKLLSVYNAIQVDKVKPGQKVPGGHYYNLFVPREHLKEFIAQVMNVDQAILYENRARGRNPPGKNRVFIWIKSI